MLYEQINLVKKVNLSYLTSFESKSMSRLIPNEQDQDYLCYTIWPKCRLLNLGLLINNWLERYFQNRKKMFSKL